MGIIIKDLNLKKEDAFYCPNWESKHNRGMRLL